MTVSEQHEKAPSGEKSPQQVFLQHLKQATLPQHLAVERTPSSAALIDPSLSREQYLSVLQRFYGFVVPVEEMVYPMLEPIFGSMEKFKRTGLLREDLQALGMSAAAIDALPMAGDAVAGLMALADSNRLTSGLQHPTSNIQLAFGIVYVLEGSKLGGQFIRRHVEATLGLTPAEGLRFFNGHGKETGAIWNEFRNALADFAVASGQGDAVISSAAATFEAFKTWLDSSQT